MSPFAVLGILLPISNFTQLLKAVGIMNNEQVGAYYEYQNVTEFTNILSTLKLPVDIKI